MPLSAAGEKSTDRSAEGVGDTLRSVRRLSGDG